MSKLQRMLDFIKIWLLLRGLSDQYRYTARAENDLEGQFRVGNRPFVDRNEFAILMSNTSLAFFWLPRFVRFWLRPHSLVETNGVTKNKMKLADIHELLDCAEPEYVLESKVAKEKDSILTIKLTTRSDRPEGKTYGVHFVTIAGGIEDLVRKFPATWALLGLALVPWILTHWDNILLYTGKISPWW